MPKKNNRKKASSTIEFSENVRVRTVPAVVGIFLAAILLALAVSLLYAAYMYLTGKSQFAAAVLPHILYILMVMVGSYVAAYYFDTRSFKPSFAVGGLFLLMSITYTISAYGISGLGGFTLPLKLFLTAIGVFAGYFFVDVVYVSWLPVRRPSTGYFVDDEYEQYERYHQTNSYEDVDERFANLHGNKYGYNTNDYQSFSPGGDNSSQEDYSGPSFAGKDFYNPDNDFSGNNDEV